MGGTATFEIAGRMFATNAKWPMGLEMGAVFNNIFSYRDVSPDFHDDFIHKRGSSVSKVLSNL